MYRNLQWNQSWVILIFSNESIEEWNKINLVFEGFSLNHCALQPWTTAFGDFPVPCLSPQAPFHSEKTKTMTTNPEPLLQLWGAGSGGRTCLTGSWALRGCQSPCRRDSQPVPLQWQLYISRAFRKWSLESQIFLQSPLSWFLICSLGLSILHKVQIFFPLWLKWQCSL